MSEGFNVSTNWRRSGKPGQEKQSPGPQKTESATQPIVPTSQAGLLYQPARLVYQTGLVIQPIISENFKKISIIFQFHRWVCQARLPGRPTGLADRTGPAR